MKYDTYNLIQKQNIEFTDNEIWTEYITFKIHVTQKKTAYIVSSKIL